MAAAPVRATSVAAACDRVRQEDSRSPLGDVEHQDDHAAACTRGTQHVRGPDVPATGETDVDTRLPGQQEREWDRAREVADENRKHQVSLQWYSHQRFVSGPARRKPAAEERDRLDPALARVCRHAAPLSSDIARTDAGASRLDPPDRQVG